MKTKEIVKKEKSDIKGLLKELLIDISIELIAAFVAVAIANLLFGDEEDEFDEEN